MTEISRLPLFIIWETGKFYPLGTIFFSGNWTTLILWESDRSAWETGHGERTTLSSGILTTYLLGNALWENVIWEMRYNQHMALRYFRLEISGDIFIVFIKQSSYNSPPFINILLSCLPAALIVTSSIPHLKFKSRILQRAYACILSGGGAGAN